ncbi:selenocysteine-specific translation elongation factor SelB [Chryseobacterium sp. StRB126]|nr:selenocysteine-specific translation elongation factor SelB [Chryseobacterium sp. StRB126]
MKINCLDGESIALTLIVDNQNHEYLKLNHYEKTFKFSQYSFYMFVFQLYVAWAAYYSKN